MQRPKIFIIPAVFFIALFILVSNKTFAQREEARWVSYVAIQKFLTNHFTGQTIQESKNLTVFVSPTPPVTGIPTLRPTSTVMPLPSVDNQVHKASSKDVVPQRGDTTNEEKKDFLLKQVNSYRKDNGLEQITSNDIACSFAQIRAEEIPSDFSHAGFNNRVSSKSLPYSSYSRIVENIAETTDYTHVVPLWIGSEGHAKNMLEDIAFGCFGILGNYYAFEGWKP